MTPGLLTGSHRFKFMLQEENLTRECRVERVELDFSCLQKYCASLGEKQVFDDCSG